MAREIQPTQLKNPHQFKALLNEGLNQTEIAETIGIDKSTISREIRRNVANTSTTSNDYCPEEAQQRTDQHHQDNKPTRQRFTEDLKTQARRWLTEEKLSPELISGRWQVMGMRGVSHEAIYQWIWAAKHAGDPDGGPLQPPQTWRGQAQVGRSPR